MAVGLATFMMLVDFAAVSVALPALRLGVHASYAELEWALEAFVVTLAAFVLTAGYIADRGGHRGVFLSGLAVFAAGSVIAATAQGPGAIVGGRVVQGAGAALIFATGSVLLTETFRRRRVSRLALALWGTVTGLSVAVSPLVGGAVVHYLGWRWLFGLAVPVSLVALAAGALASFHAPARRHDQATPDWRAVGLFTGALALFVIGLVRTTTDLAEPWTGNGVVACLSCSALLVVALVAVETVSPCPLLNMSLFRRRTFVGSAIAALGLSLAVWGSFAFLVLYLSYDLGYSALAIGLRLLLLTGMTVPFLPVANWLDRVVPVKVLIFGGLALVAGGLWWMSGLDAASRWPDLMPGLIMAGIGLELVNPRLAAAAVASAPPELAAVASRTSSTFRLVGTATGVAVMGALFANRVRGQIFSSFQGVPQLSDRSASITAMLLNGRVHQAVAAAPASVPVSMLPIVHLAFAQAMHEVLIVGGAVAFASAVCALAIRSSDIPQGEPLAPPVALTSNATLRTEAALPVEAPLAPAAPLAGIKGTTRGDWPVALHEPAVAEEPVAVDEPVAFDQPVALDEERPDDAREKQQELAEQEEPAPVAETVPAMTGGPDDAPNPQVEREVDTATAASPGGPGVTVRTSESELAQMLTAFLVTVQSPAEAFEAVQAAPEGPSAAPVASLNGSAPDGPDGPEGSEGTEHPEEAEGSEAAEAGARAREDAGPDGPEGPAEGDEVIDLEEAVKGLHGLVTAMTGEPLAGATVTVVGPDGDETAHAVVGADGSFLVTEVGEGTYTVVASAANFRPAASMVPLHNGAANTTLALLGIGALSGQVSRAKDGAPLEATIALEGAKGGLAADARTDAEGRFVVADLIEGPYALAVRSPGYGTAYVRLVVERGSTQHEDIVLTGLGHLYGAVCGPQGGWLPDVQVSLADGSGQVVATTRADGAGSYHFDNVPEGWYTVRASGSGSATPVVVGPGASVAVDLTMAVTGQ